MEKKKKDDSRARRRKRIKKIIVTVCIILILLPIVLSVFLLCRVRQLEKQIEYIIAENPPSVETEIIDSGVVKAEEKKEAVSGSAAEPAQPQVKKVYLTFDDGPSKQTERVLDILKKKNVKATFFAIGREDKFSTSMYKRIVKEGHTLGMHSYSHLYQEIYGSLDGFKKDFHKISDTLFEATGVRPSFYRFPGGSSNSVKQFPIEEYASFLNEQGVTYLDWNVLAANGTTDNVTQEQMIQSVMDGVSRYDISIVLMYDSADKKMTAKSLGKLIDRLRAENYELLPIDADTVPLHHS